MKRHPLLRVGLIAFLLVSLLYQVSRAQQKIKFGTVPIEELKLKAYDLDTAAHAVILYDRGRLEGNTHLFTRHIRLKIFKSAGAAHANFQVRTTSRSEIHGITYNLNGALIEETALAKENVFKEEIVDGFFVYKIFFPAVKPGSIVELKYSFYGLPYSWRFQERIPVKYNELVLEETNNIIYKKTMFGTHPIQRSGNRWVATDVPAFVEEPFMCHYSNYLTHFKIDIEDKIGLRLYTGKH
jgi:hypothetical protein